MERLGATTYFNYPADKGGLILRKWRDYVATFGLEGAIYLQGKEKILEDHEIFKQIQERRQLIKEIKS